MMKNLYENLKETLTISEGEDDTYYITRAVERGDILGKLIYL